MGTRSLTFVHEEDGPAIVCIYQQYDGYFDGVGDEILRFLKGSQVVNGISLGAGSVFNGAGDLAARLITYFKQGDPDSAGGVYIEPSDSADGDMGTEFAYHIHTEVGKEPRLRAVDVYSGLTVDAPVSQVVWPTDITDEDEDEDSPIRPDQRSALFATFTEVFGHGEDEARYALTRMALGLPPAQVVSWSENKPGTITVAEASKVLDALNILNV